MRLSEKAKQARRAQIEKRTESDKIMGAQREREKRGIRWAKDSIIEWLCKTENLDADELEEILEIEPTPGAYGGSWTNRGGDREMPVPWRLKITIKPPGNFMPLLTMVSYIPGNDSYEKIQKWVVFNPSTPHDPNLYGDGRFSDALLGAQELYEQRKEREMSQWQRSHGCE